MDENCACGKEATQKLIIKTTLLKDRGMHEEGETWNSNGSVLMCDGCADSYFDKLKKNPISGSDK